MQKTFVVLVAIKIFRPLAGPPMAIIIVATTCLTVDENESIRLCFAASKKRLLLYLCFVSLNPLHIKTYSLVFLNISITIIIENHLQSIKNKLILFSKVSNDFISLFSK